MRFLLKFESRNLSKTVLILAYFLTFVLKVQYSSTLHKYGVEFHQEFNGHGPRHVTFLVWPCKDVFSLHEAKKGHEIFKAEFGEGECHQENFLPSTKLGKEAGF